jgi:hypothetical protein
MRWTVGIVMVAFCAIAAFSMPEDNGKLVGLEYSGRNGTASVVWIDTSTGIAHRLNTSTFSGVEAMYSSAATSLNGVYYVSLAYINSSQQFAGTLAAIDVKSGALVSKVLNTPIFMLLQTDTKKGVLYGISYSAGDISARVHLYSIDPKTLASSVIGKYPVGYGPYGTAGSYDSGNNVIYGLFDTLFNQSITGMSVKSGKIVSSVGLPTGNAGTFYDAIYDAKTDKFFSVAQVRNGTFFGFYFATLDPKSGKGHLVSAAKLANGLYSPLVSSISSIRREFYCLFAAYPTRTLRFVVVNLDNGAILKQFDPYVTHLTDLTYVPL